MVRRSEPESSASNRHPSSSSSRRRTPSASGSAVFDQREQFAGAGRLAVGDDLQGDRRLRAEVAIDLGGRLDQQGIRNGRFSR